MLFLVIAVMCQHNRPIAILHADFTEYTVTDVSCGFLNLRLWSVSHFGCRIIQMKGEAKMFGKRSNEAHILRTLFTPQTIMHMHHGAGNARPLKKVRHDGGIQASAHGQQQG